MKKITINGHCIGKGEPPYLVVDAGVNHNGNFELAKKLIDMAKTAGADAVKFQTFKSENLVTREAERAKYQEKNIGGKESQFDMLKRLELPYADFKKLKEYCDQEKILFLSTPHTPDAIDFLDELMPAFKIGSGDLTNLPLLKAVAKKKKPIFLPTGMATMNEVKEAITAIEEEGNTRIIVMHCTSNYPCPRDEVNLRAMKTMMEQLNYPVGYSDHTLGIDVALMAAKMGAVLIEKHFTLDKNMEGPDHKASLDPAELKELVNQIKSDKYKEVAMEEEVLGSSEKKPTESEKQIMVVARKSLVTATKMIAGDLFTEKNLIIKRPGNGISPQDYQSIIGKKAKQDLKADYLLTPEDIE